MNSIHLDRIKIRKCPTPLQKIEAAVVLALCCVLKIHFPHMIMNLEEARCFSMAAPSFPAEEGTYADLPVCQDRHTV